LEDISSTTKASENCSVNADEEVKAIAKHKTQPKKKKKSKSTSTRYPTRCIYIGEIHCLFVSCYYGGRSPLISLGPSWPFTIFLVLFGVIIGAYFTFMLSMAKTKDSFMYILSQCGICFNVLVLLTGILKNPGIP
jgi:hypothetical protein